MTNQTPHTPQVSSIPEGNTIAMKPPIISPEIYERFEQLIAKPFSPEVIEACNKAQREKRKVEEINEQELLNNGYTQEDKELVLDWKNRYPDWYRENGKSLIFGENFIGKEGIHGAYLKFERENLVMPSKTVVHSFLDNLSDAFFGNSEFRKEFGINLVDRFAYFTFDSAQEEAKKLGKRIPTRQNWQSIISFMPGESQEEKCVNLVKLLGLNYAGLSTYYDDNIKHRGKIGWYWTSSSKRPAKNEKTKTFIPYSLKIWGKDIDPRNDTRTRNDKLLVRCVID